MTAQVIFYSLETPHPQCLTLQEVRRSRSLSLFKLSMLMAQQGLTPVTPSHLSGFECGTEKAWQKARRQLAIALGLSESELFPEYEDLNSRIKIAWNPMAKAPQCQTLRRKRIEQGLTLFNLSMLMATCGVEAIEPRIISGYERGEYRAPEDARKRLAIALQVPESELFPEYNHEQHS